MSDTQKRLHVVHLSYTQPRPKFSDPEEWLARVAFVSGVAEKMAEYADQTVIYNIDYKGEINREGVRYLFPGFKRRQLVLPIGFNNYIKGLKPDVVLIHGLIFPWQLIMLRWATGPRLKIIVQHHAERPFNDFRKFLFRKAEQHTSAYLFASKEQAREWNIPDQKIHEIMGTSSIFHSTKPKSGKVFLWVGDLDANKDPLMAARAFNKFSGGILYMIYQKKDLEKELEAIASSNIHLVGKVKHAAMQEWFNKADFIISTSHYEGSGIAVCEGMSCGCIPIVRNIPSFRMMTNNGSVGRLFENEEGLVDALQNEWNIEGESKKVLAHFKSELSFEANARKIMNVINNTLA